MVTFQRKDTIFKTSHHKKTFTINYEEYYLTHIDQHLIGKLVFKARFNITRIQNINSHISTKTLISHC